MVTTASLLVFMTTMLTAMPMTNSRILDVSTACLEDCVCDRDLIIVSCINGSLTEVPRDLPVSVRYLNLSGNAITELHNNSLTHLPELRYLNLAGNNLSSIVTTAFNAQSYLRRLDLRSNGLCEDKLTALQALDMLVILDLHGNSLSNLPGDFMAGSLIEQLDLSYNELRSIPEGLLTLLPSLAHLNLSNNHMEDVTLALMGQPTNASEPSEYRLRVLDLSHNELRMVNMQGVTEWNILHLHHNHTGPLNTLTHLFLSHNPIANLWGDSFSACPNLEWLEVNHMSGLRYVDMAAFSGLTQLRHLYLSHNTLLSYLHAMTFTELTVISEIDLSNNSLTSINDATFQNLTSLKTVRLAGNPWVCDCDSHWLVPQLTLNISDQSSPLSANDFICSSPPALDGLRLVDILPTHNFSCHRAYVVKYTHTIAYSLGSSAILNCVAGGDPKPSLTWITPRKDVIRYHPAFVHPGRPGPQSATYHNGHSWHGAPEVYVASLPPGARRMHVLPNGSLYIDYVQRHDAGRYTCLVHNHLGNDSVVVYFHLNYLVITRTMVQSMIIGFLAAAIFLALGLITAMIRYLVFTCSREQRQKRKSVREILDGLETYRSVKMDKLSAYKAAKIDQLAAFKTAKVDKLRGYKNITVTTLVHYLQRSREHYTNQTVHIKENCAQQVEKLRESYSIQKLKFKDYRSHQVDKIKDNYNGQLLKIRLYGSGQLEKLQSQYKLQQQHILKLLELLDIGNCMSALEAECLRTDSMIFNSDLSFDLEAAVYLPQAELDNGSLNGSEYMTAGDNTDQSSEHSNSGSVIFDVKLDADPLPPTTSLSSKSKAESISCSTLTQLKVDLAAAGLLIDSDLVRDSKDLKYAKGSTSAASTSIIDNIIADTSGNSTQGTKGRHSRRKHRHKHHHKSETLENDDDDEQCEKCEKRVRPRRVSPKAKDRQNKRDAKEREYNKAAQVSIGVLELGELKESWIRNHDILSHAAEIDKTLDDIATDINNLKEPLNLCIPDFNIDLSLGINTDPVDELTPTGPVTTVSIESEAGRHCTPSPVSKYDGEISPHHQGAALREKWQKGSDPPSIEAASTDYESAQEPESRGNTPQVGFYEHTGSPQSFASFPSTPSTPTLSEFPPIAMFDPAELDNSGKPTPNESAV